MKQTLNFVISILLSIIAICSIIFLIDGDLTSGHKGMFFFCSVIIPMLYSKFYDNKNKEKNSSQIQKAKMIGIPVALGVSTYLAIYLIISAIEYPDAFVNGFLGYKI